MAKIPDDARDHEIIEALAGLEKDEFSTAAQEIAFRFDVSVKRIYQLTRRLRAGRRQRSDAGKALYSHETLEQLAARALQKNYCAADAIEEAIMAGELEPNAAPSARTLNRFMVSYGINTRRRQAWLARHEEKKPDGSRVKRIKETGGHRIQAPAANVAWQIDTTRAAPFWIRDLDGSVLWENPTTTASKNHRGRTAKEDRFPIHLYSIVDDKSRYRFAWCYAGVNQYNTLSFLQKAMSRKTTDLFLDTPGRPEAFPPPADPRWKELTEHPDYTAGMVRSLEWINPTRLPLRGIPEILFSDQGPELKNKLVQSALKRMGIRLLMHAPEHSNATGKVENSFDVYKPCFEKIRGKKLTLYQINLLLLDYTIKLNSNLHSTTCEAPVFSWLSDEKKIVRELPDQEICKFLSYRDHSVLINYFYEFSIDGIIFKLPCDREPFLSMCKRKVRVYVNHVELTRAKKGIASFPQFAAEWAEKIYWFDAVPASSVEPIKLGEEFRSLPESFTEKKYKELMQRELVDPEVPGYYNEIYASNVLYPQRAADEEVQIDFGFAVTAQPMNIYQAMELLQKEGVFCDPIEAFEKEFIEELFGQREEVPESEIRNLIRDFHEGRISIGGEDATEDQAAV